MKDQLRKTGSWSVILMAIALLIFLFGLSENAVLRFYSNGVYTWLSVVLRSISSIFPFAIGDLVYVSLLSYGLVRLIRLLIGIKKKKLTKQHWILVPLKLLNFVLALFIAFKLLWGLNYARPKIAQQLKIENEKYNVKQLAQLGNYFVDKLNILQPKIDPSLHYSVGELRQKAISSYQSIARQNTFFTYQYPSFKPALNSWIVSKLGIEGYYNPLSAEANINMKLPPWVLPFVACHEISHQIGVAKEDEANLVAYLVGLQSKDINFQYAVNYNMLRYILLEIRMKSPEDYLSMRNRVSPALLANFQAENDFWRKYNGQMSGYMGIAFDKLLKLNQQKRGIKSYQDIVIWLWNYHKHELKRDKQVSLR